MQRERSHPVFGEEQIDGGVSDDVHAQLEGLDLPGFARLGILGHFHGLVVSWQEELPQTVPEERGSSFKCNTISVHPKSWSLKSAMLERIIRFRPHTHFGYTITLQHFGI